MELEIKMFGYPITGVKKSKEQRLEWAIENEMVMSVDKFNSLISEENYIYYWDVHIEESKPKLLASKFLEWYITDNEDLQLLGKRAAERMKKTGYCDTSVEELFNDCRCIPETILEGYSDYLGEAECRQIELSDVEFINDLKK